MPTSCCETITPMVRFIKEVNPKSVLDVGAGCGKYGLLAREYLEIWQSRPYIADWIVRIDAVEIWGPYLQYPGFGYYNQVYNMDIREYVKDMPQYDLAICGDVLEHLAKGYGWEVLSRLLSKCRYVLVSLPLGKWPCPEYAGNPYEKHISTWDMDDLDRLPVEDIEFVQEPRTIAVALIKGYLN